MNWNELQSEWARQELPAWPVEKITALEDAFGTKQRKLRRAVFWRDIREAVLGLFVAAIFANTGWKMGAQGWPVIIAVVLLVGLSGFFVRERIRVRHQQPAVEATLLVRLDAEIAEQQRQHHLLTHVAGWYLTPILGAGAVFGATVLAHAPVPLAARFAAGAAMMAILAACGAGTIWLNRWAVRRVIEPQLRELETWRDNLVSLQ